MKMLMIDVNMWKVKMTLATVWTLISIGICTSEVSAYSARRHDSDYLLHDTQEQPQQQHQQQQRHEAQEIDEEVGLKAGTGSSQSEISFHPVGDFGGPQRFHELELSPFDAPARTSQQHTGPERNRSQKQNFYSHRNGYHHKTQTRTPDGPRLEGFDNELSSENDINANNGNYVDNDNIYKQEMPRGSYDARRWSTDASAGDDVGGAAWSWLNDDGIGSSVDGQKRSAFHGFKRQRSKKQPKQFIPGISVGAMTNLGDFFDNLKNNIDFLEKEELTDEQLQLLEGQHPLHSLRKELSSASDENESSWQNNGPHGTAAFIHAIRTYRPSHRIRNLISAIPEGYRGSNSYDPNYQWIGLGKRSSK